MMLAPKVARSPAKPEARSKPETRKPPSLFVSQRAADDADEAKHNPAVSIKTEHHLVIEVNLAGIGVSPTTLPSPALTCPRTPPAPSTRTPFNSYPTAQPQKRHRPLFAEHAGRSQESAGQYAGRNIRSNPSAENKSRVHHGITKSPERRM
jgi:hypothetical protein